MNLLLLQQWTDEQMQAQQNAADWGWTANIVPFAMYLVAGVALLAILWSAINMFKNPAGVKKFAIGFVTLLVLAAICYFVLASGEVPAGTDVSENVAHWVGAGISMTCILIGIGLLILVIDLVRGIFKI